MHIADGILPVSACVAGFVVSLTATTWASRKLESEEVPRMGMLAAATFVASMVHIPIAGTSVHFSLFGLLGMLLGLRALPVVLAVLLLQTFLFQHGGLLTLGVNTTNMSMGALAGYAVSRVPGVSLTLRAFLAGLLGMVVPALLVVTEFQLVGYGRSLFLLFGLHVLLGLAEGAFASMVTTFLARIRPSMLTAVSMPRPIAKTVAAVEVDAVEIGQSS